MNKDIGNLSKASGFSAEYSRRSSLWAWALLIFIVGLGCPQPGNYGSSGSSDSSENVEPTKIIGAFTEDATGAECFSGAVETIAEKVLVNNAACGKTTASKACQTYAKTKVIQCTDSATEEGCYMYDGDKDKAVLTNDGVNCCTIYDATYREDNKTYKCARGSVEEGSDCSHDDQCESGSCKLNLAPKLVMTADMIKAAEVCDKKNQSECTTSKTCAWGENPFNISEQICMVRLTLNEKGGSTKTFDWPVRQFKNANKRVDLFEGDSLQRNANCEIEFPGLLYFFKKKDTDVKHLTKVTMGDSEGKEMVLCEYKNVCTAATPSP